ncbi:coiled-coil domain-containing protein 102B isoform X1 [Lagopus muta]|uniref:coiled-coil domain-containing protein 102B isoform X1 n=1 Tax=Lagopus muta TaxID=64668 RepID=UPI0020A080DD|nr:coiled-coil domain-containing protein 102B isoform X1 [Lagopus muta]XP_048795690.1 coiled-coil domain-containing protein 102B isoform X1 [Lagopus muta]XP_048795691.1 coiled-coil domain-containing protein 102B isoform X1 [Lagopus muta]
MNQNMDVGYVQHSMEDIQIFRTQPRQPNKIDGICQTDGSLCNSNLPSQNFYPYSAHYTHMHMNSSSDLEIFEAVRIRELEEVKARAAQMEKTMRWWSDCTANWREKWSKVRAERNKAREEARQLRIKLESVVKELSMLKKINQDLVTEKESLENVTTWKTEYFSSSEISHIKKDLNQLTFLEQEHVEELNKTNRIPWAEDSNKDVELIKQPLRSSQNKKMAPKHLDSFPSGFTSIYFEEPKKGLHNAAQTPENDLMRASVLHLHLAELQKILTKEREMNVFLEKEVEKTENELALWKLKYEELKQSKLESLNQLERWQFENTSEWGKRERPDAQMQSLEEERRRLKLQVKEIQELLEMKNKAVPIKLTCDHQNDHQNAQSNLPVKNKEACNLQHVLPMRLSSFKKDKPDGLPHWILKLTTVPFYRPVPLDYESAL